MPFFVFSRRIPLHRCTVWPCMLMEEIPVVDVTITSLALPNVFRKCAVRYLIKKDLPVPADPVKNTFWPLATRRNTCFCLGFNPVRDIQKCFFFVGERSNERIGLSRNPNWEACFVYQNGRLYNIYMNFLHLCHHNNFVTICFRNVHAKINLLHVL